MRWVAALRQCGKNVSGTAFVFDAQGDALGGPKGGRGSMAAACAADVRGRGCALAKNNNSKGFFMRRIF